jgi:hypothetical protein
MFALLAGLGLVADLAFTVRTGSGLELSARETPLVRGTWFQYYEPGWTKGYYSSTYGELVSRRLADGTLETTFKGEDSRVSGRITYRLEGNTLVVRHRYEWGGDTPVKVETTAGMFWADALEGGTVQVGEAAPVSTAGKGRTTSDIEARRYGPDAQNFAFQGPLGELKVSSTAPLTLFDARNYGQPWAETRELLWLGNLSLDVTKDRPAEFEVRFDYAPRTAVAPPAPAPAWQARRISDALAAPDGRPPLIPHPWNVSLDWDKTIEITGAYSFPAGRFRHFETFKSALARRFLMGAPAAGARVVPIDGGMAKLGLPEGGYQIQIRPTGISVLGQEEIGLRYAVERLASLAFVRNGRLVLPTGQLIDRPRRDFRGVHLFVGPTAPAFHKRLWERVLLPMGFNKVVLQCERTAWNTLPGTETPITMRREDLAALFRQYRDIKVEPIPLIQSFGHMGWMFANGRNLDLAFNKDVPFTLDPRVPRTQKVLDDLWAEAIELLQPKTVHFGLDEVDMRGFPSDPALVTDLWQKQLPILTAIAQRHQVRPMFWGDKMLAPGEAIDATHGDDPENAAARRAALPKNAVVADWHYKGDVRSLPFQKSLQVFRKDGLTPVASMWHLPRNIYGFTQAANMERAGTLQTTWAGYESSQANMEKALHQFTAMVVAGDYSWSGRALEPDKLPYNAADVFWRMFYGRPGVIAPVGGRVVAEAGPLDRVGEVATGKSNPMLFQTTLRPGQGAARHSLSDLGGARGVALVVDTLYDANDGDPIARIDLEFTSGPPQTHTLAYGRDVRAARDSRMVISSPRSGGRSAVRFALGNRALRRVTVTSAHPYAGLRLYGVTVW